MKKFYDEYFHIPEDGTIKDKVMISRIVTMILTVVVCLIAMAVSAYAFFSNEVSSNHSVIHSADFNVTVTLSPATEPNADGSYLLQSGSYEVTLEKSGDASTGFCQIKIEYGENVTEYHTRQLGTDVLAQTDKNEMTFTLELDIPDGESATVRFISHWGTSCYYYNNSDRYVDGSAPLLITPTAFANELDTDGESTDTDTKDESADTNGESADTDGGSADINGEAVDSNGDIIYVVAEGDTLTKIANNYGTTVIELAEYNGIEDPSLIYIGMEIRIPSVSSEEDEVV